MSAEAAQCTGKKRYTSWAAAAKVARWQSRRHTGFNFQPYHCRLCQGIHTGEESPGKRDHRPHDRDRGDAR